MNREPGRSAEAMTDQLIDIGKDLGSCWYKLFEIQDECFGLSEEGSRDEWRRLIQLRKDEQCLLERTWALETMATQLRATSLPGALVQVVMAHRYLREMTESDLDVDERQAACRSIERLLYSLADCLEAEIDEPRESLFGDAYMPRQQDPSACVPEALGVTAEELDRLRDPEDPEGPEGSDGPEEAGEPASEPAPEAAQASETQASDARDASEDAGDTGASQTSQGGPGGPGEEPAP